MIYNEHFEIMVLDNDEREDTEGKADRLCFKL